LSLTSSPCSSVSVFSIRRSRYRWSAPPIAICAFSGWLGPGDGMILSTVPGMVVLGRSEIRAAFRFSSVILADLAIRGVTISFLTLARIVLPDSLLLFLCSMHPSWHRDASHAVPFRTVAIRTAFGTNQDEGPRSINPDSQSEPSGRARELQPSMAKSALDDCSQLDRHSSRISSLS
jgi:hypothetical protein